MSSSLTSRKLPLVPEDAYRNGRPADALYRAATCAFLHRALPNAPAFDHVLRNWPEEQSRPTAILLRAATSPADMNTPS